MYWLVGADITDYRADTFATDTRKARLFVQADF
jgi:hypothetical protein